MQEFKYKKPINTGDFRHRIEIFIENDEPEFDEDGFPIDTPSTIAKPWAAIKTLKGSEYYSAAGTQAEVTIRFVIRYRKGITSHMKIKYDNRVFDIVEPPINDDELHKTLTIIAKERV